MSITAISIKQLFGKYDYSLDLTKRANILVGANGVGKTTMLKILYFVYRDDLIQLRPFKFKEIIIEYTEGDQKIVIKRSDLFPNMSSIKENLEKYYTDHDMFNVDAYYYYNSPDRECLKQWEELLDELEKKDLLFDFLSDCYLLKNHSFSITKVINQFDYFRSDEETALRLFNSVLVSIKNLTLPGINPDWPEDPITDKNIFYIDFVQKYNIDDKPADKPALFSPLLKWFSLTDPEITEKEWYADSMLGYFALECNEFAVSSYRKMFHSINDFQGKGYVPNKNSELSRDERHPEHDFLVQLLETSTIKINTLINKYYYSNEFVVDFNKRALRAYAELLNDGWLPYYQSNSKKWYDDYRKPETNQFYQRQDVIDNYIEYFNPILVEGHPFKFDIRKLTSSKAELDGDVDERHAAFIRFYEEELPVLVDEKNRSSKIRLFEKLLSKYSQNKQIEIKPCGLLLFDVVADEPNCDHLSDHRNVERSIDLNAISSGEKKIILLLALAIFVNATFLLIDEPELSLSILWQEQILPDLISRTELKNIIVATHSPFIASDESLTNSIVYLPQNEENHHE